MMKFADVRFEYVGDNKDIGLLNAFGFVRINRPCAFT